MSEDKNEIFTRIAGANEELEQLFASIPSDRVNTVPFKDSWTAAQVADHILKSQRTTLRAIKSNTVTTERDPGKYIPMLRDIFLDFDKKMKSPEFVLPANEPLDKQEILDRMKKTSATLQNSVPDLDLSLTCTDINLPKSAPMTRSEWLHFLLFHTQRHNRQLKKVAEALNGIEAQ